MHLLERDLSPAVIVLVNSHAFAPFDALKEPSRDDFGGRIFESFHFIEKSVIKFFDKRHNVGIDLRKVLNKAARINCPTHYNIDTVVVPVHIFDLWPSGSSGR